MENVTTAVTTTVETVVTTSVSEGFRFDWNGINFLLVIIYGGIIILLIVFFIKRTIHRVHLRFSHNQTKAGTGAPKKLLDKINEHLDQTGCFNYEPQLLLSDDQRLEYFDDLNADNLPPNYLYRMKTVDALCDIDGKLTKVNKVLARPMGKSVKQHLIDAKSHSSGCLRSVRSNQLQAVADSYLHARYGSEVYQKEEYNRFMNLSGDIINSLDQQITHRAKTKKKSLNVEHPLDKKQCENDEPKAANKNSKNGPTDDLLPAVGNEEAHSSKNVSYFEIDSDEKKKFLNKEKKK